MKAPLWFRRSLRMAGGLVAAACWLAPDAVHAAEEYWLDLCTGEETSEAGLLDDLDTADVIYIGEVHTIERHHQTQVNLMKALAGRGKPLALGLEQIEARCQPAVDRFNRGEIDFDGLAKEIEWKKQWKNFEHYRPLCEAAQSAGVPLRALNAPAPIIRAIGRGGIDALTPGQRAQLPKEIVTDDPDYEKLMNILLAVHATMPPDKLRPIFEAQVARDETMAANIADAMLDDDGGRRTVIVVCGRGHIGFGLGTPDRVRRRGPASVDRILLVTESGQLVLSPAEEAMRREITLTHGDLRALGRPLADYLRVMPRTDGAREISEK